MQFLEFGVLVLKLTVSDYKILQVLSQCVEGV